MTGKERRFLKFAENHPVQIREDSAGWMYCDAVVSCSDCILNSYSSCTGTLGSTTKPAILTDESLKKLRKLFPEHFI